MPFFNQLAAEEAQNALVLQKSTGGQQIFIGGLSIGKTLEWLRSINKVVKALNPYLKCALMKHENIQGEAEGHLTLQETVKRGVAS